MLSVVIFVCRNVKDACVSWYHHQWNAKHVFGLSGSFEELAEVFKTGRCVYGDYWAMLKVSLD